MANTETHVDVQVRTDDKSIKLLRRTAEMADLTIDQVASAMFAVWCLHNLPEPDSTKATGAES